MKGQFQEESESWVENKTEETARPRCFGETWLQVIAHGFIGGKGINLLQYPALLR